MIIDTLAGMSAEQLKTAYMAENILRESHTGSWAVKFEFGDPDITEHVEEITNSFGNHTWTYTRNYLTYHLPDDWYDRIYLQGIGAVTYNNKRTLVVEAEPSDVVLRKDLQMEGFQVHKVMLPVFKQERIRINSSWRGYRTVERASLEERFMVSCVVGDKSSAFAFAAVHANAAAANLKRKMMKKMMNQMGV